MVKTGVVVNIEKNKAFILTPSGEFAKVKIKDSTPRIGETFSGEPARENHFYKYSTAAAVALFMLFASTTAYAYYTPTASVVIDINPSVKLKLNRWNRILSASPLNSDGSKILQEVKLKNKPIGDGLKLIVDESKKDNFINEQYKKEDRTITVFIDGNKSNSANLSSFQQYIDSNDLNLRINNNGNEIMYKKSSEQKNNIEKGIQEKGNSNKSGSDNKNIKTNINNGQDKNPSNINGEQDNKENKSYSPESDYKVKPNKPNKPNNGHDNKDDHDNENEGSNITISSNTYEQHNNRGNSEKDANSKENNHTDKKESKH